MGISKKKAAEILGRSRSSIYQAVKRGTLVELPGGLIDTDHPTWTAYASRVAPGGKRPTDGRTHNPLDLRPVGRSRSTKVSPDLSMLSSEELARLKQEADVKASFAKSEKAELDLAERRGELVDRATLASTVFGYLGRLNLILLESIESEIELYFDRAESMSKQELVKLRKEILTKHLDETAKAIKSELRKGRASGKGD